MVISLIAWTYISILCFIWGRMFLSAVSGKTSTGAAPSIHPSLVCLAGLAVICTLALLLSLFLPLDWKAHLVVLLVALIYCLRPSGRQVITAQWTDAFRSFSRPGLWLFFACIAMVLVISTHTITHPDTTYYHARSILLFERYPAIPGIANLRHELGFQSGWFAALALFKLDNAAYYNIIFLNGAVLCWFLLFVSQKISGAGGGSGHGGALLLLSYTLFSWTQIRLTAASPSPDFIVSLYSWAAFYVFFLQKEAPASGPSPYSILLPLFCMAAVLTKLSAIALIPLGFITTFRYFRQRSAKTMIIYSFLAFVLLLVRNLITSGYALYPVYGTDLFSSPWKMKASTIIDFQHYISTYARFPIDGRDVDKYWQWQFPQWIPGWWEQVSLPDRLLLLGIVAGLVLNLIIAIVPSLRKKTQAPATIADPVPPTTGTHSISSTTGADSKRYWISLAVALGGSLIWLLGAPSPRFGTGFLIPLFFLLYQPLLRAVHSRRPGVWDRSFRVVTYCLFAMVATYTVYREIHFSSASQWFRPAGIDSSGYDPLGCENISVDLLHDRLESKPPGHCFEGKGGFAPIGTTISAGFQPPD